MISVLQYDRSHVCPERFRLLNDYSELTRIYAESVAELRDLVGYGGESDVDPIRRACRQACEAMERARIALFRHEADHYCDRYKPTQEAASA